MSPAIGLEAGNVSVAAITGITFRLGSQLDADFGAPRAGSLGGSLSRRAGGGWSAYLFASLSGRYQPYDIFLDEEGGKAGDPIRAGEAITRDQFRGEASLGAVLAYGAALVNASNPAVDTNTSVIDRMIVSRRSEGPKVRRS